MISVYAWLMLLALAPMKDVTDLPFLRVLSELGTLPDYLITEYFRVNPHHVKLDPYILQAIDENPTGLPIYGQLVGTDADSLVRDALNLLQNHPVAGIDLNMGCPAALVCRKAAGGGMLKTLKNMESVLASMREALPLGTFTVKCRIGWEDPYELKEILSILARHCPDRLVIHARTVREGYRTHVHTDCLRMAVESLSCPVIAKGNIVDVQTAQSWITQTHPAGLMIGRGVIRNPWIFDQIRSFLRDGTYSPVSYRELLRYVTLLLEKSADFFVPYDEKKHIQRLKRYLIYIACGLPDEFGYSIKRAVTQDTYLDICHRWLDREGDMPHSPPINERLFACFHELYQ
ncbi:MAG: tRNA-dihydrouridine synthase family protein [Akkermansia sp.]